MKLIVDKQELLNKTQLIQVAVASTSHTLPILSNVLIDAESSPPKLTATDLELGITTQLNAEVIESGAVTVPARKLVEIVKELPNMDLTLVGKKNNTVTIEGERMNFRLSGFPKEEFPKIPIIEEEVSFQIKSDDLKEMIDRTVFAISQDETRYVLNGSLFVIEPKALTVVSTDGRRLAVCSRPMTINCSEMLQFIVPSKTIHEVQRNLSGSDQASARFSKTQVAFSFGDTVITSRLIEGEFPNFRQVIPPPNDQRLTVKRDEFLGAIRRVSLFTTPDSRAVKFELLSDRVIVSKSAPSLGDAVEEVPGEFSGKQFSIGFNPSFLLDVLKQLKADTVAFEMSAPDKPSVVRLGNEYVYIVLPVQLNT